MSKKYCSKCGKVHNKYMGCPNRDAPHNIPISIEESHKKSKTYADMNEIELMIQKFYNSKDWRKLRDKMMTRCFGLCECCYAVGLIVQAKSVHHIIKLRTDFSKRLDEDNLICLCDSCHRTIEECCSSKKEVQEFIEQRKKKRKYR